MQLNKRYKTHQRIAILSKSYSKNSILICAVDEWLLDIVTFNKNTQKIVRESSIILPDLNQFISFYERSNYQTIMRTKNNRHNKLNINNITQNLISKTKDPNHKGLKQEVRYAR